MTSDCVMPPMECPNINITFWLYTRLSAGFEGKWSMTHSAYLEEGLMLYPNPENHFTTMSGLAFTRDTQDNPAQILAKESESIKSAPWINDAPIKILIHGYTGDKDVSPNTEIRPAYMQRWNYNIISVDYSPIVREPCYISAARNVQLAAKCTAQLIDSMVKEHGFELAKFHVIGFSLGGQTAGAIANYLESGTLSRVTGLDPAMPLFVTTDKTKKLDSGDAEFVDVLHTDALERGKLEPSGDVDFFANGGLTQPGCKDQRNQSKSSCDHARAPAYYAESIVTDVGFYGTQCMAELCKFYGTTEEVLFGEYVPTSATGIYFFQTNSKPPYAKGSNKNTSDNSSPGDNTDNLQDMETPPEPIDP